MMGKPSLRIAYIYQDEYPWDVRVEKITSSLSDQHYVTILSRNRSDLALTETVTDRLKIRRLPFYRSRFLRALVNTPAFFSPFWIGFLLKNIRKRQVQMILVRDLPLAATALLVGKICSLPVILDMAEDYPAMTQDEWTFGSPKWFDWLIRNPRFLKVLERFVLKRLNGVLVVSEASKKRVLRLSPLSPGDVCVIQNVPRISAKSILLESDLARKIEASGFPKLIYVGFLNERRGLSVAIDALILIKREFPNATLWIIGDGIGSEVLRDKIRELGLSDSVFLPGWVDQKFVGRLIRAADIGVIPHRVTAHTNTTLPNKIYDYMAAAKPVVASNSTTLREFVEKYKCGVVFDDGDPESMCKALTDVLETDNASRMGRAGELAVSNELNWESEARSLLVFIDKCYMQKMHKNV